METGIHLETVRSASSGHRRVDHVAVWIEEVHLNPADTDFAGIKDTVAVAIQPNLIADPIGAGDRHRTAGWEGGGGEWVRRADRVRRLDAGAVLGTEEV